MQKKYLTSITEHFPGMVAMYDIQTGKYLYVNNSIKKLLGYKPEDFIKGGYPFVTSLVHPDDLPRIMEENNIALAKAMRKKNNKKIEEPIATFEYRMRHKDGKWVWLFTEGTILERDKKGKPKILLNTSLDITEVKDKELRVDSLVGEMDMLQENNERFRKFIEVVEDYAIFRLDKNGNIVSWNEGGRKIFGYNQSEILGKPHAVLFAESEISKNTPEHELEMARTQGNFILEGLRVRNDGTYFFASVTITAIFNKKGRLEGYSKIVRDITERRESEETIKFHAFHDTLTGLPNRKAFNERFALAEVSAGKNQLAVLFLDLDRFKNINDTLGHGVGDGLLVEVGNRLQDAIRPNDMVARLGGDEFIILLSEIESAEEVINIADKIMEGFNAPINVENHTLHVTPSIGISLYPIDGEDIYTLLKNADTALYQAKASGKNRYQFYDRSINTHSIAKLALENDLRIAVKKNEITFHYQPIVNKDRKLIGAEALIRWNHPRLGLLLPGEFITIAEETGLISSIGNKGKKIICDQYKYWKDNFGFDARISINISGIHFAEFNFINEIQKALHNHNLSPGNIEIEITESVAMNNTERTAKKLSDLQELGVGISIDDFGTGYSSLSYLKRFPINKLKIDKSFIKHCTTDEQDKSIVRAIIAMGHSLGVQIIAEGVEDEDQFEFLVQEGCDGFQGYLFDKPLQPAEFLKWLS